MDNFYFRVVQKYIFCLEKSENNLLSKKKEAQKNINVTRFP